MTFKEKTVVARNLARAELIGANESDFYDVIDKISLELSESELEQDAIFESLRRYFTRG